MDKFHRQNVTNIMFVCEGDFGCVCFVNTNIHYYTTIMYLHIVCIDIISAGSVVSWVELHPCLLQNNKMNSSMYINKYFDPYIIQDGNRTVTINMSLLLPQTDRTNRLRNRNYN